MTSPIGEPEPSDLLAIFEQGKGRVDFLGSRRTARQLAEAGERLTAALACRGFTAGRRITVLLPNTPSLLIIFYAGVRLGLRMLLLDPRSEEANLKRRLAGFKPELLFTSNPAALFDKVLRILPACPSEIPVVVERFTDLLAFPRNLLAPLLRGGGIATLPPDPRFLRYMDFIQASRKQALPQPAEPAALELLQEAVEPEILLQKVLAAAGPSQPGMRWLVAASLAESDPLATTLCGLHGGADLVLSPRLDRKSLNKVGTQAGTDKEIP